ncbi:MAG: DNA primase [Bacteroidales bacterium]|nr:DNA primase [Bacteroidales bacterium]
MIPQETVNLIIDTARIEEVVGDFVTLKRQGGSYWACCPFHNEKTPSFHVVPSRGIYKCFGCGKAGSAVGFLMEYERLSYSEALRYLANKYHIEIQEKEETAEEIAARQRNESLLAVSDFAFHFYKDQLKTTEGRSVGYQYFRSRGLEDETIEKYGLGWAPKGKSAFTEAAREAGYKAEYLTETGLCSEWDDGSLHDRFYDRVMFPIHSVSGRVIAFGGRTLLSDKSVAKYVNSKESEIYVKSRSLYGIYFAKNEIAKRDRVYLVEGYLDVLSFHQLGLLNTVASSGTSLTVEQIRLMKRFSENVTIMYDGDPAGIHAALRGIDMVLKEGMNVKVVLFPDGDDPDSFSRKHTLEEVETFIARNEQDFIGFKTDLLLADAGRDPLKRAGVINDIADSIAQIPDAVKRSVYTDDCAAKFNIDTGILFDRIRRTREKALADERAERDRERNRERYLEAQNTTNEEVPEQVTPTADAASMLFEDPIVAPSERELLSFILRDGTTPLRFESDSEFYAGDEPPTVAEFIDAALDGVPFVNTLYRLVYDAYFVCYDEGLSQEQAVKRLLDGEDRTVATVAAELSEERYALTVTDFAKAMTTHESWLVSYVPRAILVYQDKKMQSKIRALTRKLATAAPADQEDLLREIERTNAVKRKINIRLGRERKE